MYIGIDFSAPELVDPDLFAFTVRALLEGLVPLAQRQIPFLPPLYESGVVFADEVPGVETFALPRTVYGAGFGDCAHLSLWRVAELRNHGEPAGFRIRFPRLDPSDPSQRIFHVAVRRGNGNLEDPSILLGDFPNASAV